MRLAERIVRRYHPGAHCTGYWHEGDGSDGHYVYSKYSHAAATLSGPSPSPWCAWLSAAWRVVTGGSVGKRPKGEGND